MAVSMEDCRELALRLFYLSAVYTSPVCVPRSSRSRAHGVINERCDADERNHVVVDDNEGCPFRQLDREKRHSRIGQAVPISVEAGRMGLSMSVVTQMSAIMLSWMTTKAAPFGSLIAKNETPELDRLFRSQSKPGAWGYQ